MVFIFRGYDENGVPTYEDVPHGDQRLGKPQEAAEKPEVDFKPLDAPADFCTARGGTISGTNCILPDGTTCDQGAFYRGECGMCPNTVPAHYAAIAIIVSFFAGYFFSLASHD